jgi:hypothetical protein
MKFCPNCGNGLSEHAKFCVKCGQGLTANTQSAPIYSQPPIALQPAAPPSADKLPANFWIVGAGMVLLLILLFQNWVTLADVTRGGMSFGGPSISFSLFSIVSNTSGNPYLSDGVLVRDEIADEYGGGALVSVSYVTIVLLIVSFVILVTALVKYAQHKAVCFYRLVKAGFIFNIVAAGIFVATGLFLVSDETVSSNMWGGWGVLETTAYTCNPTAIPYIMIVVSVVCLIVAAKFKSSTTK